MTHFGKEMPINITLSGLGNRVFCPTPLSMTGSVFWLTIRLQAKPSAHGRLRVNERDLLRTLRNPFAQLQPILVNSSDDNVPDFGEIPGADTDLVREMFHWKANRRWKCLKRTTNSAPWSVSPSNLSAFLTECWFVNSIVAY